MSKRQPAKMTERQVEVVRYLVNGFSDKQIAALLGVKPSTIQTHIERACIRVGAYNRVHLAALAIKSGVAQVDKKNGPVISNILAATKGARDG